MAVSSIQKRLCGSLSGLLFFVSMQANGTENLQWSNLPAALGWIPNSNNLCWGQYSEPSILQNIPKPLTYSKLPTKITAEGPSVLQIDGTSVLHKHVVVKQPGRLSQSDVGYIHRDGQTKKVSSIDLKGHVKLAEYEKLLLGSYAHLDFAKKTAVINDAVYRITGKTPAGQAYNAWGQAQSATRTTTGLLILHNATLTTCSPLNPSWQLNAKKITIDADNKRATARNAVIHFKGVPIMYAPYYSFSLDKSRKTGFLTPAAGYSSKNGLDLLMPYYINLAPNYDLTLTPEIYTARGFMLGSLFRYLTEDSIGHIHGTFLPQDQAYKKFLQENNLTGNLNRWFFNFNDHTHDQRWDFDFNINQVSDSYYFQNYSDNQNLVVANQLLNQTMANYHGDHWQFQGMLQGYQTLHPTVTQSFVPNQYQRLPEFDWIGQYPRIAGPTGFDVDSQFVNFGFPHSLTYNMATGQRYNVRPALHIPLSNQYAYFTPSIYLDYTYYNVVNVQPGQKDTIDRTLPIANLNGGLYFDRSFKLKEAHLTQTLEPQFNYVYIPYTNQSAIPVYDTIQLPFTYPQLFALNQYSGLDRIQNTNQITTGVTTRLLNSEDGTELLSASVGEIFYLAKRKVTLPGSNFQDGRYSPIVAQLAANPSNHWSMAWNYAWDPVIHHTNNNGIDLNFHAEDNHLIDIGYDFAYQDGAGYNGLNRLRFGAAWPMTERISALGYVYYNLTAQYPDSYFAGLQYDTCCWAIRGIVSTNAFNEGGTKGINPRTTVYIQFQLKGLGNVGNSDPSSLLSQSLPYYQNIFRHS